MNIGFGYLNEQISPKGYLDCIYISHAFGHSPNGIQALFLESTIIGTRVSNSVNFGSKYSGYLVDMVTSYTGLAVIRGLRVALPGSNSW